MTGTPIGHALQSGGRKPDWPEQFRRAADELNGPAMPDKGEMNMFWAILLTIVICSLLFLVLVFRAELLNTRSENNRLYRSNQYLSNKLRECRDFETERRVKDSYNKGLYDGRETDTAYRELLKRCKDGNYDAVAYERLQHEKAGARN